MSQQAVMLLTYVWHYVVARLLYDDLVRPIARDGGVAVVLAAACLFLVALLSRKLARRRQ